MTLSSVIGLSDRQVQVQDASIRQLDFSFLYQGTQAYTGFGQQ